MINTEIILNLWYVHDTNNFIYSLRARAYVGNGTDEDKLDLLKRFAEIDYLISKPFPIPARFQVQSITLPQALKNLPITHKTIMENLGSDITLFEDAIKQIEAELPAQTHLNVPQSPLVCITPLMQDENGDIVPFYTGTLRA